MPQKDEGPWSFREVAFALSAFTGTGRIEQEFSFLQMYSEGRKARTGAAKLRRSGRDLITFHRNHLLYRF